MLVTVAVIALVLSSLAVGALAAHWPFWHRAWQWQSAAGQWPAQLSGPTQVLSPSATPLPLRLVADSRLAPRAGDAPTQLLLAHAALARALFDVLGMLDRVSARFVVDMLAQGQLFLDDVDFADVLEAARPHAGLQANDAARDFGRPLQQQQDAGQRDHRLEMIDRRPVRGHSGMLVDAP